MGVLVDPRKEFGVDAKMWGWTREVHRVDRSKRGAYSYVNDHNEPFKQKGLAEYTPNALYLARWNVGSKRRPWNNHVLFTVDTSGEAVKLAESSESDWAAQMWEQAEEFILKYATSLVEENPLRDTPTSDMIIELVRRGEEGNLERILEALRSQKEGSNNE